MVTINPKHIIVDFLRSRLVDPRARAEASNTQTIPATAGQTDFQLTAPSGTVSAITALTVDAVTQEKWRDYYPDFQNQKAIFFTGLTVGQSVVVTYKYGTDNWIFRSKANKIPGPTKFPRMNIFVVTGSGSRLGQFEAPVESQPQFQLDIWCKEKASGQIFTIGDHVYTGEDLADYLAHKVTEAFEDNEEDLHPAMYDYNPIGIPRDMAFDIESQSHHKVIEFTLKALKLGRIGV